MDYKSNRKKGCRSNDTGGINMETDTDKESDKMFWRDEGIR